MYVFFEEAIRGGFCQVSSRYSKANNQYCPGFDPKITKKFISFIDANNLYGYAMRQYLPVGNFNWGDKSKMTLNEIMNIKPESDTGCTIEVDLHIPAHLHDYFNDFPLAPENKCIDSDLLSKVQVEMQEKWGNNYKSSMKHNNKLVATFHDKIKYKVHYRTLQLYVKLGVEVTNIHRVLTYDQSPWMRDYIDLNTNLRKQSKNEFEKGLFKLLNNSVFGKTMECVRDRLSCFIYSPKDGKLDRKRDKELSSPYYKNFMNIDETDYGMLEGKYRHNGLSLIFSNKGTVKLNKPIYAGATILDDSKCLMYDFFYNFIKVKYADNAKLLYMDTDSFILEVCTEDIYKDAVEDKQYYDLSNFVGEYQHKENNKVVGKFKFEFGMTPITEFIGLGAKNYSVETVDSCLYKSKCKGVSTKYSHDQFKECLMKSERMKANFKRIGSNKHQIHTIDVEKWGLNPYSDKRYYIQDSFDTLAYGHNRINN